MGGLKWVNYLLSSVLQNKQTKKRQKENDSKLIFLRFTCIGFYLMNAINDYQRTSCIRKLHAKSRRFV